MRLDGKELPLEDVKLRGDRLSFKLAGRKGEFSGQVKGKQIEGTVESGGTKSPWSATLGRMKLRIDAGSVSSEIESARHPDGESAARGRCRSRRARRPGAKRCTSPPR